MNAQIMVAFLDGLDGLRLLAQSLAAGERASPAALGQAGELLEQASHRVRGVANGMIPPEPVVRAEAAE